MKRSHKHSSTCSCGNYSVWCVVPLLAHPQWAHTQSKSPYIRYADRVTNMCAKCPRFMKRGGLKRQETFCIVQTYDITPPLKACRGRSEWWVDGLIGACVVACVLACVHKWVSEWVTLQVTEWVIASHHLSTIIVFLWVSRACGCD